MPVRLQQPHEFLHQEFVLNAAAAQHDRVEGFADSARVTDANDHVADRLGDAFVEAGGHRGDGSLPGKIDEQSLPHLRRLDAEQPCGRLFSNRKRIRRRGGRRIGDVFQFHGTLAFEQRMISAQSQGRSNSIEEPATGTGQRHVKSSFQHAIDRRQRLGGQITK